MSTGWTYGAELEWPDVNTRAPLPPGWQWSATDYTIVNSNGIANDPKRQLVLHGGELNTPPATSPHQLAERAHQVWEQLQPGHNYRSNLHIHVRIPGLTVDQLKTIATFTRTHLPGNLSALDPLTGLLAGHDPAGPTYPHAQRRLAHSRRSRHYLVPANRHQLRLNASTIDSALAAEVPASTQGRPQWHLAPREAVNLRALRKHGTIEFRCFAAPTDADQLHAAAQAAHTWIACALDNAHPTHHLVELSWRLPRQHPYDHRLETGWRHTNLQHNTREHLTAYLNERGLLGCA